MKLKQVTAAIALALGLGAGGWSGAAHAGAVITFGNTSLGVNDGGELNFFGNGPGGFMTYGVFRAGVGDAISPGCPCEGWGVAVQLPSGAQTSGFLNQSIGNGGLAGGTFGSTTTTATSTIGLSGAPITVRHAYGPSLAADVFQAQVTITNTSTTETIHNLRYRRVMDWDVPPTPFSEFVTHQGVAANLTTNGGNVLYASDNGFASSNPLLAAGSILAGTINTNFTDSGPADHGSAFDFAFGELTPGASRILNIFYGSASSEAGALAALSAVGANVYSLGQNSGPSGADPGTPATFLFGFGGVGGVEPGTLPSVPILPFVPAPGQFVFDAPIPRRWFDPPLATGFTYELLGGGIFLELMGAPGFNDLLVVGADGTILDGDLDSGESFFFGPGVSTFSLLGINPAVDAGDPTAFPTFLDFTVVPGQTLTMRAIEATVAVPEPSSLALVALALVPLGVHRRRRAAQQH